ncbi:acyl carrier protein [Micromonospora echinospora]|uniref:acyl carrier protein n=1 Tax=Micromonospora echinospora TaxID=1877 RepID=UPI003A8AA0D1
MSAGSRYDRTAVEKVVVDQVEAMGVESAAIHPDATLEALGLDSLDLVELSQGVRRELDVPVHPKDFAEVKTLADALDVIFRKAGLR